MTLEQFQNKGFDFTDKEVDALIKQMLDNYNKSEAEILKALDKVYAEYLTMVDPDDIYNIMIKHDRLNKLLKDVQETYMYYAKKAGIETKQLSSAAMSNSYYRQQYVLTWLASETVKMKFSILNPLLIELSVTGTQESWKAISANTAKKITASYGAIKQYVPQYGSLIDLLNTARIENVVKMQQIITQGFIQGQSKKEMGTAIKDFMNNTRYQADRIARTESTRVMAEGDQLAAIDAEEQGIEVMRMWVSALDTRTRPRHAALDGKFAKVNGPFPNGVMRPGAWPSVGDNIHCRCRVITVNVIDGEPQQPTMRTGRNPVPDKDGKYQNETFEWKSFNQWAMDNKLNKNKYGQYYFAG